MIKFIVIPLVLMMSCGSTKTKQSSPADDSVVAGFNNEQIGKDSLVKDLPGKTGPDFAVPLCIKNKLDSFKLKAIHERPQKVVEYTYKGQKVYYVLMPCCDFFNEVYDGNCNFLGSPDGGITGKGDGKLPDFFEQVIHEKLIWQAAK